MTDSPPPAQDVEGLIERVEAAAHGSMSLDLDVMEAVWPDWRSDDDERLRFVTSSLDAALALVERVLPGQWWNLLYAAMQHWRTHTTQGPERLPLMVILALLKALRHDQ